MMFEAVEFVEKEAHPEPVERVLGEFDDDTTAVEMVRQARTRFRDSGSKGYAWWVVRKPGATLAEFIADSRSDKEFVLDMTSGELVEV